MNTTIKALQELYVKLGGSLTDTYETIADGAPVSDYVTIPDMIQACTQKAGSGGGGGGEGAYFVTLTEDGSTVTADKTPEEIYAAYASDALVYFKYAGVNIPLLFAEEESESYTFNAAICVVAEGKMSGFTVMGTSGAWAVEMVNKDVLPDVDSADEDKVLKVVDGEWGAYQSNNTVEIIAVTRSDGPDYETLTTQKNAGEIEAFLSAGKTVIFKEGSGEDVRFWYMMSWKHYDGYLMDVFSHEIYGNPPSERNRYATLQAQSSSGALSGRIYTTQTT